MLTRVRSARRRDVRAARSSAVLIRTAPLSRTTIAHGSHRALTPSVRPDQGYLEPGDRIQKIEDLVWFALRFFCSQNLSGLRGRGSRSAAGARDGEAVRLLAFAEHDVEQMRPGALKTYTVFGIQTRECLGQLRSVCFSLVSLFFLFTTLNLVKI